MSTVLECETCGTDYMLVEETIDDDLGITATVSCGECGKKLREYTKED